MVLHRPAGRLVRRRDVVRRLRGPPPLPGSALSAPELHPRLEHLAFLLGTWHGFGVVGYPTMEDQPFEQEVVFAHDGRPFLSYSSHTWLVDEDGVRIRPSGTETGFWRPGENPRDVEVVLAHPTGIVEVYVGEVVFHRIELATELVACTATAKRVSGMTRLYGLVEGDLAYAVDMAAVGQPLQAHFSAKLSPVRLPESPATRS